MSTVTIDDLMEEIDELSEQELLPVSAVVVPDIKAQSQYPRMV